MTALLEIRDLKAEIAGKQILNGYDLTVKAGEVHAIMGPNGSGKSTLSYVLSGRPGYTITEGQALLAGADLSQMSVDERRGGLFLASISAGSAGRRGGDLLRTARSARARKRGRKCLRPTIKRVKGCQDP
jgi:Fe-S cluster assembly ATP-binding protein